MPTDPDVLELAAVLGEEGFGFLAGEMLMTLERGAAAPEDAGTVDDPPSTPNRRKAETVELDGGGSVERRYFDDDLPEPTFAGPVARDEQLRHALGFLALRLVEPLRAAEEAERLAGEMRATGGKDPEAESVVAVEPLLPGLFAPAAGSPERSGDSSARQSIAFAPRRSVKDPMPYEFADDESDALAAELEAVLARMAGERL